MFKIPGVTKTSTSDEIVAAVAAHIATLDKDALSAAIAAALAEAASYGEIEGDVSDEDLAVLETLAKFVTEAEAALTDLAGAEQAKADRLAAARAALAPKVEDKADEGGDDDGENDSGDDPAEDKADEAIDEKEKEPVAAAGTPKTPAARRAAASAAEPVVEDAPAAPRASITASADVPGLSAGQVLTKVEDLVEPTIDVLRHLKGSGTGARVTKGLATFGLQRTDDFVAQDSQGLQSMLTKVRDESRLKGGSLTAAGGWCAPSETLYDLCDGETTDGLWDIPSINVARGGLNFTKGPQFSDFYGGNYILQTEAQAIAGTEKECVEITCPPFTDVRLDVMGVCITVPILTEAAYPELVNRWIQGTLVAHQHRKSINLLNRALTIAGSAVTVANPWPTAGASILAAIELVVLGERQRYRLALNATLEAVFPFWVKSLIRADLSVRTGVDMISVTDQMIESWFTQRGVRAQFLYGWQGLVLGGTGTPNGPNPAIDYPDTLEILLYPAGTFVQGTKDVITLNGVYDSVGLSTNVYTALFTEEGISLMNMCYAPKRISLAIPATGLTGAPIINQNWGAAAPFLPGTAIPNPVLA